MILLSLKWKTTSQQEESALKLHHLDENIENLKSTIKKLFTPKKVEIVKETAEYQNYAYNLEKGLYPDLSNLQTIRLHKNGYGKTLGKLVKVTCSQCQNITYVDKHQYIQDNNKVCLSLECIHCKEALKIPTSILYNEFYYLPTSEQEEMVLNSL